MTSYSQQRRTDWINKRSWELASQDPFNGAPDPVAAAKSHAEFEWSGRRQYDSTQIIRTDGSGRADPEGDYVTVRALAASSAWSTTYTYTELEELGIEIATFLHENREGDR